MQYNSPVILTFFLLSLGVLFLGQYTGGWTTTHLFSVYRSSLKDPLFYIRLFGHVLGHGSWDHFLNNMLLLLVVGPPMEEKYPAMRTRPWWHRSHPSASASCALCARWLPKACPWRYGQIGRAHV